MKITEKPNGMRILAGTPEELSAYISQRGTRTIVVKGAVKTIDEAINNRNKALAELRKRIEGKGSPLRERR